MPANTDIAFMLSFAAFLGVAAQLIARAINVPGIVALLALGLAVGPDGLKLIQPAILGHHLSMLVGIAVAIILFEGGLQLQFAALKRNQKVLRRLVTTGALLTACGAAVVAHFVMGLEWRLAALFGTLVIVTGPTVVSPLLKRIRIRKDVHTILHAEGVLIDPVGALIAIITLDVITSGFEHQIGAGLGQLAASLAFGAVCGAVCGLALIWLLKHPSIVPDEFANIVTLGTVLVLFTAANQVFHESGIMAVTIAGIVVGNGKLAARQAMLEFKEQLTMLLIGLLFILLTANIRISDVIGLGWKGLVSVLGLSLVVRPLVILWSARGAGLSGRSKIFMAFLAPRGIVAAAVASIFAIRLDAIGVPGGRELQALVFLVIVITVCSQGLTADLMAKVLHLRLPRDKGYVVIGANPFALAFASQLVRSGDDVVIVDNDPSACRRAEHQDFRAICGNAMKEQTLRRARVSSRKGVIAATSNASLNMETLRKVRAITRDMPLYLVQAKGDITSEDLRSIGAQECFGGAADVEYWSSLAARHLTSIVKATPPEQQASVNVLELLQGISALPLLTTVGSTTEPFCIEAGEVAKADTVITMLVHTASSKRILSELGRNNWTVDVAAPVA